MYSRTLLCLTALATIASAKAVPKRSSPAPLLKASDEHRIDGMYIVKMKDGFESDLHLSSHVAAAERVYTSTSFKGFAKNMDQETLATLRDNPMVEYVKEDQSYYLTHLQRTVAELYADYGIARISHRDKGHSDYEFDSSAGAGTCIYMIDTGINIGHPDFNGRAVWGFNAIDSQDHDGQGHGTYTAGIAGSTTYGVAKQATLIAVKVADNNGRYRASALIDALSWVGSDAPIRKNCPRGHAVNLSLGGNYDQATNDAAAALVKAGIFIAVSAGNDNADARGISPASEPSVCTVAASDQNDAKAGYSNFGSVVDIWAPGTNITSTSYMGGIATASGTSAASPIVAGLGAYLLGLGNDAKGLCQRIKSMATKNVVSGVPEGTVNLLAFNGNTLFPSNAKTNRAETK
ncbi:peptidase S8/S53 domain-containing protein [Xylariaceae sp. FL1272]|nr:peptidase S8/S53 domain-containing protein [Xylariaceae sp. FL1272]